MALGNIEIRVYDDQVIISNPGSLPEGVTLEELKKPLHASVQRNPLLAQTFYYAGLVERWGTGAEAVSRRCQGDVAPGRRYEVL
jgi:ATP-dependent DNA helicase RecG